MQQIHDLGYTKLFSNKEIFRQLLTSFVHEKWVKDLDFTKCELLKGSFVSKKYKKTFSDLLYKVKLRGRDVYIVVLLEFKSTPQRFPAVQMAGYIMDFYRHLIDSEKRLRMLPPVFPVLLYSGKRRWTLPLD
ncbi:Rpn family recombination-promoting nuclease/putative transposase, partial [candidate division KSB1 bacterium]|nr:Rpn family recombination-promoting nuclease/putative transposase [candidate division KSB1 bacterium]